MKLSIVLSTQPASFSALAYKGNIEENIARIKELGYDGVELAVRNPNELDVNYIQNLTTNNDLPVPAIGTGQAFGEEGLSFTNPNPEIRKQAIQRTKDQIHFAKKFDALVIIGLLRGIAPKEMEFKEAENLLLEALKECAEVDENVKIAIEPINRYETNLINTVSSGMDFLEKLGKENVGLLLDTFHMNIEEPDIEESIVLAKDKFFHFHVADSNRWHPGAGHLDFGSILNKLEQVNYSGFVSAEIMPLPNSDMAAIGNIEHLRSLLK
ncbi:MAG: sugar phosphate isomerase/epimerase [Bacteroidetes bacterium]|nr:sugar phosphate isomerase/epimerase [Bacteroidota bacterium]